MAKIVKIARKTATGVELISPVTGTDAIPDFASAVADQIEDNVITKTAAQWETSSSLVLANGQFGLNKTNYKVKIGDGVTTWANLSYVTADATLSIIDRTAAQWEADGSMILGQNQLGRDTTHNWIKIGDGATTWANLPFVGVPSTTVEIESGNTTTVTDTLTLTLS